MRALLLDEYPSTAAGSTLRETWRSLPQSSHLSIAPWLGVGLYAHPPSPRWDWSGLYGFCTCCHSLCGFIRDLPCGVWAVSSTPGSFTLYSPPSARMVEAPKGGRSAWPPSRRSGLHCGFQCVIAWHAVLKSLSACPCWPSVWISLSEMSRWLGCFLLRDFLLKLKEHCMPWL